MAKQIKFLSQNQYSLFQNQNQLLTHVQDTQDLNNRRFLNMAQHMAQQRNVTEIWAEIRQTRRIQNDTETEIHVVEVTMDYMNYMYTVFLPALEGVVNELKLKQAAYHTLLQGYLPTSLIPPSMLADIVNNANEKLRERNLKLAISNLEFLYTMKIATTHQLQRSLYVTLLLQVTQLSLKGYFHLYKVNTYPVPTDHFMIYKKRGNGHHHR